MFGFSVSCNVFVLTIRHSRGMSMIAWVNSARLVTGLVKLSAAYSQLLVTTEELD